MQVYLVVETWKGTKRVVTYSSDDYEGKQIFENLTDAAHHCKILQDHYGYLNAKFHVATVNL